MSARIHPSEAISKISYGHRPDIITIAQDDCFIRISVEGDPTGSNIFEAIKAAYDQGLLLVNSVALVDLRHFTGTVDWQALRAIRDMAAWGQGEHGQSRVAYLVRSSLFEMLIKATSALFPATRHRIFYDEAPARRWLLHRTGTDLPDQR